MQITGKVEMDKSTMARQYRGGGAPVAVAVFYFRKVQVENNTKQSIYFHPTIDHKVLLSHL